MAIQTRAKTGDENRLTHGAMNRNEPTRASFSPPKVCARLWNYADFRAFKRADRCSTLRSIAKGRGREAMALLRATTIAARAATGGSRRAWRLAGVVLLLAAAWLPQLATAQSAAQCPVFIVAGNFQSGNPGQRLTLDAKQTYNQVAQPAPERFTWVITQGDAVFSASGLQSVSQVASFQDQGSATWDAFTREDITLGSDAAQTVVVEVQSDSCRTQGAGPAQFLAFINPPPPVLELVPVAGDGAVGSAGDLVQLAVRANDPCAAGGPRRRPGGSAECPVDLTFTVTDGSAAFTSGRRTVSKPSPRWRSRSHARL